MEWHFIGKKDSFSEVLIRFASKIKASHKYAISQ